MALRIRGRLSLSLARVLTALLAVAPHLAAARSLDRVEDARLSALQGDELREALRNATVQAHRSPIDYSTARRLILGEVSEQKTERGRRFIREVYCQRDYVVGTNGAGAATDDQGRGLGTLNVEHTWPQSLFGAARSRGSPKSDLHHLFPTDSEMNGRRGNFKFGEVNGRSESLKCSESRLSDDGQDRRFEPPDAHKGNVARALFYFSVRYSMPIDPDQESVLKSWNRLDPVDAAEIERNDKIERVQGNRNPFIDRPELVDRIADF